MSAQDEKSQNVLLLFIPTEKIQQALVDVQTSWSFGFAWVRSCDFLKDENKFAVQVVMNVSYPYLENRWKEIWQ